MYLKAWDFRTVRELLSELSITLLPARKTVKRSECFPSQC